MNGELKKAEDRCPTCDRVFTGKMARHEVGLTLDGEKIEGHCLCGDCYIALRGMNDEQRFDDFYNWVIDEVQRAKVKRIEGETDERRDGQEEDYQG